MLHPCNYDQCILLKDTHATNRTQIYSLTTPELEPRKQLTAQVGKNACGALVEALGQGFQSHLEGTKFSVLITHECKDVILACTLSVIVGISQLDQTRSRLR